MKYLALLRGVNVGGKGFIKMAGLKIKAPPLFAEKITPRYHVGINKDGRCF